MENNARRILIEQEVEVLKEVVLLAYNNFDKVTPVAFEPSPAERAILLDIYCKLFG